MNNLFGKLPIFVAALCLFACATGTLNIPYEMSPSELIQRAQEASDRNRYNYALQYYQALLERNATNIDLVCTAEYEIAFIHYKQKKYAQARTGFNNLLMRYDMPNGELLPQQFKLLAHKVLERIDEKEKNRSFFSRKA
jgi:outer membrane protein assembly factor BamD (BamD/ComL family)